MFKRIQSKQRSAVKFCLLAVWNLYNMFLVHKNFLKQEQFLSDSLSMAQASKEEDWKLFYMYQHASNLLPFHALQECRANEIIRSWTELRFGSKIHLQHVLKVRYGCIVLFISLLSNIPPRKPVLSLWVAFHISPFPPPDLETIIQNPRDLLPAVSSISFQTYEQTNLWHGKFIHGLHHFRLHGKRENLYLKRRTLHIKIQDVLERTWLQHQYANCLYQKSPNFSGWGKHNI